MSSANTNTVVIVEYPDWVVDQLKYMPPRINDKGGKAISIISTQSNRALAVSSAPMTTWGIRDFVNDEGESDGKYKLELQFPSEQYKTPETDEFLAKMKAFEQKVIDDAVINSELWWGKKKSRELVEDAFFPYLKYPKDEKKINYDYTKAPGMKPKIPCYNGEWKTRVFDVDYNKVFPSASNPDATPVDFVPKGSQVVCGLKCNGIWIGGKGWGITWQVDQLIVKPRVVQRVDNDICHLKLSDKDRSKISKPSTSSDVIVDPVVEEEQQQEILSTPEPTSTEVPDSDDEAEAEPEQQEPEQQEPVVEPTPVVAAPVKKVIKKAVVPVSVPVEESVPVPVPAPAPVPTVVKKIVKKKV